ncbi:FxsA family protein [Aestuariivirga sp.]|uniref:FxsA family protein n=1 Tax=Aestuariivirga sp. TaxID=2650926 RepID=UPI003BAB430B
MLRLLPLLLLTGFALEIATIVWVGGALGLLPTLLLLLGGGFIGVSLIKAAGTSVLGALRSPVQTATPMQGVGEVAVSRVLSGLLFLIPGFLSDIFGILVLLPPVRRWLRSKIRVKTFSSATAPERRYDRVIDAEAIEITADIGPAEHEGTSKP